MAGSLKKNQSPCSRNRSLSLQLPEDGDVSQPGSQIPRLEAGNMKSRTCGLWYLFDVQSFPRWELLTSGRRHCAWLSVVLEMKLKSSSFSNELLTHWAISLAYSCHLFCVVWLNALNVWDTEENPQKKIHDKPRVVAHTCVSRTCNLLWVSGELRVCGAGIKSGVSCMIGKDSTDWAMSPVPRSPYLKLV